MKKKLITLLALVAIVSGVAFAVQEVGTADSYTDPGFTTTSTSEGAVVVADAKNIPFVFELQADNNGSWIAADEEQVFDTTWNVRSGFTASFRILTTDGTQYSPKSFNIDIDAAQLVSGAGDLAGAATLSGTVGTNFTGSFTPSTGRFAIATKANHYYNSADTDALTFNVTYAATAQAPAARYTSDVTVTYNAL
ncbi:MAG: hypothetical protein EOL97_03035 [Spirochaetia bacterium]|nr:hypothetical protein [Spirochaetia bacterium]